jgi:hypothetical protein
MGRLRPKPNRKDPPIPLTATVQAIKAYQAQVEKNQITSYNLPECVKCGLAARHFKIHTYRERPFLIIDNMMVQPEHVPLVRFRCPACNKPWPTIPILPFRRNGIFSGSQLNNLA